MATTRRRTTDLDALRSRLASSGDTPGAGGDTPGAGGDTPGAEGDTLGAGGEEEPLTSEAGGGPGDEGASAGGEAGRAREAGAAPPAPPAVSSPPPARSTPSDTSSRDPQRFATALREEPESEKAPALDIPDAELAAVARPGAGALVTAAVLAALVAGGFGYAAGYVMIARSLDADRASQALTLSSSVSGTVQGLRALSLRLDEVPAEGYQAGFEQVLRDAYGNAPPVVSEAALVNARLVLAFETQLVGEILQLSSETRLLRALVERHLQLTERDLPEIQRELAGAEDNRSYGVIFDLQTQAGNYQRALDDDNVSGFTPVRAAVVSYDSLDVITEGSGAAARDLFRVTMRDGSQQHIPVFNLVVLPREHLLEGVSSETALSRYRGRVQDLRTRVGELAERFARLPGRIEAAAGGV